MWNMVGTLSFSANFWHCRYWPTLLLANTTAQEVLCPLSLLAVKAVLRTRACHLRKTGPSKGNVRQYEMLSDITIWAPEPAPSRLPCESLSQSHIVIVGNGYITMCSSQQDLDDYDTCTVQLSSSQILSRHPDYDSTGLRLDSLHNARPSFGPIGWHHNQIPFCRSQEDC